MECKKPLLKGLVVILFFSWFQIDIVESANILGFFVAPSKSHIILDVALMKGLAAKKHNVRDSFYVHF